MAKESPAQTATIERVMHEFEQGDLKSSAGTTVADRRQAIAIGLSEAGVSNQATPQANRRNRARTKKESDAEETTKAALYAEARKRDVPGRSTMTKAQLARALA